MRIGGAKKFLPFPAQKGSTSTSITCPFAMPTKLQLYIFDWILGTSRTDRRRHKLLLVAVRILLAVVVKPIIGLFLPDGRFTEQML